MNIILTPESLWNYYRGEVNDDPNENNHAGNYRINDNKTKIGRHRLMIKQWTHKSLFH